MSVTTPSADAATLNFCGRTIASNNGWDDLTGQCSGRPGYRFTFVSSEYRGAGNIDRIKARMAHYSPARFFAWYAYSDNSSYTAICYYGIFGEDYPVVAQHEDSGASHTIYGVADQRTDRTGCRPEGV